MTFTPSLKSAPELMTTAEFAALLRITPDALRKRLERGMIPPECIAPVEKPRRFVTAAVRRWLNLDEV